MDHHPNFLKQMAEIKQREKDRHHLEALAMNVRHDLLAVLKRNPGFELDVDRWGTERIVLRYFPNTENDTFRYALEFDFETGETT